MLGLGAAIMLMLGGLALLAYGVAEGRQRMARRVGLVVPVAAVLPLALDRIVRLRGAQNPLVVEAALLLGRLGLPPRHGEVALAACRIALALVLAAMGRLLAPENPVVLGWLAAAGLGVGGWLTPSWLLRMALRRRAQAAVDGLPDALELLVICVEAGLSLEEGLDRVVAELRPIRPALAEQLAVTSADLRILPSRDQALSNLADRIDRPAVRSVVTTLSQTMRYGTPLAQALRVVAAEMRNEALIGLEERANRLPVLMTVPLMLFIMPTIFLIVGGPAALHLIDTFLR
ncbi:MAG: type II secretion system F family protein [Acetobacteraceae bacterium]